MFTPWPKNSSPYRGLSKGAWLSKKEREREQVLLISKKKRKKEKEIAMFPKREKGGAVKGVFPQIPHTYTLLV